MIFEVKMGMGDGICEEARKDEKKNWDTCGSRIYNDIPVDDGIDDVSGEGEVRRAICAVVQGNRIFLL